MIASLAEPAMLMIVFTLALIAGSTQLSTIAGLHASRRGRPARLARPGAGRADHRGDRRERAHPGRQSGDASRAHHGARGDGAGIFRPPSRADRARRRAQAPALRLADRLPVRALGHGAGRRRAWRAARSASSPISASSPSAASCSPCSRPSIAKMRVFRVPDFLGAALMLGLLGDAAAVRVAELLMHGLAFDIAHLLAGVAGAGELHAALPGPALRAAQRLRAACPRAGALGRLAGLHPGRAASLHHRGDRAGVQGDRHPGGAAPDHRAARHPSRDRDGGRRRPDHAARHRPGRAVDGGDAAGDRRGRSAGARGPRLRARRSSCSAC